MASITDTSDTPTKLIVEKHLNGHTERVASIAYLNQMHLKSVSADKSTRGWDLETGEEIVKARDVCVNGVSIVEVSKEGQFIVTVSGTGDIRLWDILRPRTVLRCYSKNVTCIHISPDDTLLASGSTSSKLVRIRTLGDNEDKVDQAGLLKSSDYVGTIRFSSDGRKLAVKSHVGKCIEIWDIEKKEMIVSRGKFYPEPTDSAELVIPTFTPIFWTNEDKTIVTTFLDANPTTIYEFDASTLHPVAAFEGHTKTVTGLALSFDDVILASCSLYDNTIRLWAFKSCRPLAWYDVQRPSCLVISPNAHQMVYTTQTNNSIHVCNLFFIYKAAHRHVYVRRNLTANCSKVGGIFSKVSKFVDSLRSILPLEQFPHHDLVRNNDFVWHGEDEDDDYQEKSALLPSVQYSRSEK